MTAPTPRSTRSRLGRQFGWVALGRIVGAVVQAASLALLARWAGPTAFGVASVMLGIIVVLQVATDLGVPTFILRQRAADPGDPAVTSALRLNGFTAIGLSVLCAAVIAVAALIDPTFWALLPLAVWAAADRNTDTWLGLALADGDAQVNTLVSVIRRVASLAAFVGLIAAQASALVSFSVAYAVVSVLVNVAVHHWARRRLVPDGRVPFRRIIRQSFAFWVNSVGTQLRNLDTLVVGAVAGASQTAFYAAAARVTGPLRIVPTSLAAVLVPAVARDRARGLSLRSVTRTVGVVVLAMAVVYGAIAVAAPTVVPLLLGDAYRSAVVPFQIVVLSLVLAGLASNLSAVLQGTGQQRSVATISVVTTGLCLGGVALGAFLGDAVGAAWALASSFIIQSILLGAALLRQVRSQDAQPARQR